MFVNWRGILFIILIFIWKLITILNIQRKQFKYWSFVALDRQYIFNIGLDISFRRFRNLTKNENWYIFVNYSCFCVSYFLTTNTQIECALQTILHVFGMRYDVWIWYLLFLRWVNLIVPVYVAYYRCKLR